MKVIMKGEDEEIWTHLRPWLWADSNEPKFSPIMKAIGHDMGVDADRWNPRIFGRSKRMSFRACPAITFVHKEGSICRRVDADLGFPGRVQGMDQKEAVRKLTKRVDNP